MLVNMTEMLQNAHKNHMAIAAINTPGFDIVRAAVDAAEELQTPIILDHASAHDECIPLEVIGPYMVERAKAASIPIAVNLDHGLDMDYCLRAIKCGFSSLMYDCSMYPYEENVARVKALCEMVRHLGYSVEAEIGRMPGYENAGGVDPKDKSKYYTDPDVAADFAEQTKCDALAVCIGTEHGFYEEQPTLNIELLKEIRAKVRPETSLVMHGSSGAGFEEIRKAISAGIAKVNYYTYMSIQAAPAIAKVIEKNPTRTYYNDLCNVAYKELKKGAREAILCMRNGR
ncbi:MAG: class II fructose-bisphosphate aldolase [Candidatus Limiplasma sp.]|nr:class II fructose-bisphosphate aldolase [Candidatus Limiplasma sp.]